MATTSEHGDCVLMEEGLDKAEHYYGLALVEDPENRVAKKNPLNG